MMTSSRKELMDRTLANLEFIYDHVKNAPAPQDSGGEKCLDKGPYEVTQLINSFLLTVFLNWDNVKEDWDHMSHLGCKWPKISQTYQQPEQAIKKIRDALAHGLFTFEADSNEEIAALHLWTCCNRDKVDWNAEITVSQMREMLDCFYKATQLKTDHM